MTKNAPEKSTKTQQNDLLRPRVGQKVPARPGSTISTTKRGPKRAPKTPAVRFVTAKKVPERAPKTWYKDFVWPRVGQKEPPRPGLDTTKSGPERATKTRQYDLLRPRVGQKKPPRPGGTICYDQEWVRKSHPAVRFRTAKNGPERAIKTRQYAL